MTAQEAAELDAFCIVRVLFRQRYLSRPNRSRGSTRKDATRRRLYLWRVSLSANR
jgi:hypothetical protein